MNKRDSYPVWPAFTAGQQNPYPAVGQQIMNELQDLAINRIPQYRDSDLTFVPFPAIQIQQVLQPGEGEDVRGRTGTPTLYDQLSASVNLNPDRQPQAYATGNMPKAEEQK